MWFGNWYDFYIVQKEVESDSDVETDSTNVKIPINSTVTKDIEEPIVDPNQNKQKDINYIGKQSSVINIVNEHENRYLQGVIQGV